MPDPYSLLKPLLFRLDPERAHGLGLRGLRLARPLGLFRAPALPERELRVLGLRFPNPVGVAAGLDKDAEAVAALFALGFGFVEVGTVTPRPQAGNPRPRLYRLVREEGLINRMGFNNAGLQALRRRLESLRRESLPGPLGVNIGRNKTTPNEEALADYRNCLEGLHELADYVVLNISSPNTPGLRELQSREALHALLEPLLECRDRLRPSLPLVLKVAPDLEEQEIEAICSVVENLGLEGLISGNTTRSRAEIASHALAGEEGGLSGAPLLKRSNRVLELFRAGLPPSVALIGAGGITRGEHAAAKLQRGADLVQVYSGLIFRGPALVTECRRSCLDVLQREAQ